MSPQPNKPANQPVKTPVARAPVKAPAGKPAPAPTQGPVPYTRFSDKLTGTLDQIGEMIQENARMIDMIQELALELTHSIGNLHTLVVKYAGIANSILDVLLPIVRNLPIVPENVKEMLVNLERITQRIVDNQAATGKTIADVQTGLRTGDVSKLQSHTSELKSLSQSIMAILPK